MMLEIELSGPADFRDGCAFGSTGRRGRASASSQSGQAVEMADEAASSLPPPSSPSSTPMQAIEHDSKTALPPVTDTLIRVKNQAPLKKEFIVSLEELKKALGHKVAGEGDSESTGDDASSTKDSKGGGGGGGGGTKKKRNRGDVKNDELDKICKNLIQGNCTYGEKCKYPHDIAEYLKQKPEVRPPQPRSLPSSRGLL